MYIVIILFLLSNVVQADQALDPSNIKNEVAQNSIKGEATLEVIDERLRKKITVLYNEDETEEIKGALDALIKSRMNICQGDIDSCFKSTRKISSLLCFHTTGSRVYVDTWEAKIWLSMLNAISSEEKLVEAIGLWSECSEKWTISKIAALEVFTASFRKYRGKKVEEALVTAIGAPLVSLGSEEAQEGLEMFAHILNLAIQMQPKTAGYVRALSEKALSLVMANKVESSDVINSLINMIFSELTNNLGGATQVESLFNQHRHLVDSLKPMDQLKAVAELCYYWRNSSSAERCYQELTELKTRIPADIGIFINYEKAMTMHFLGKSAEAKQRVLSVINSTQDKEIQAWGYSVLAYISIGLNEFEEAQKFINMHINLIGVERSWATKHKIEIYTGKKSISEATLSLVQLRNAYSLIYEGVTELTVWMDLYSLYFASKLGDSKLVSEAKMNLDSSSKILGPQARLYTIVGEAIAQKSMKKDPSSLINDLEKLMGNVPSFRFYKELITTSTR